MSFPSKVAAIDLMMGLRAGAAAKKSYASFIANIKDKASQGYEFPVQYMFKDVPYSKQSRSAGREAPAEVLEGAEFVLPEMDRVGVERAMISCDSEEGAAALRAHPKRFIPSASFDANEGSEALRRISRLHGEFGLKALTAFPAGMTPQVPINDKKMYPFYAKCVELDIPVFVCAGIPGPRLKSLCQHVELIDEVMYDFPELRFITRHGCEPWEALAVKLMLKWPNLYYSTSAFAPKHYPKAIIDFANTRGADKILYAGYFPMGLSLDRIFSELPGVPFKAEVWPKFLRENAVRVLKL